MQMACDAWWHYRFLYQIAAYKKLHKVLLKNQDYPHTISGCNHKSNIDTRSQDMCFVYIGKLLSQETSLAGDEMPMWNVTSHLL